MARASSGRYWKRVVEDDRQMRMQGPVDVAKGFTFTPVEGMPPATVGLLVKTMRKLWYGEGIPNDLRRALRQDRYLEAHGGVQIPTRAPLFNRANRLTGPRLALGEPKSVRNPDPSAMTIHIGTKYGGRTVTGERFMKLSPTERRKLLGPAYLYIDDGGLEER